jgi:hypothetical protein
LGAGIALAAVRGMIAGYTRGAGQPGTPARRATDPHNRDVTQG